MKKKMCACNKQPCDGICAKLHRDRVRFKNDVTKTFNKCPALYEENKQNE